MALILPRSGIPTNKGRCAEVREKKEKEEKGSEEHLVRVASLLTNPLLKTCCSLCLSATPKSPSLIFLNLTLPNTPLVFLSE
jgi:hypothetical protein